MSKVRWLILTARSDQGGGRLCRDLHKDKQMGTEPGAGVSTACALPSQLPLRVYQTSMASPAFPQQEMWLLTLSGIGSVLNHEGWSPVSHVTAQPRSAFTCLRNHQFPVNRWS